MANGHAPYCNNIIIIILIKYLKATVYCVIRDYYFYGFQVFTDLPVETKFLKQITLFFTLTSLAFYAKMFLVLSLKILS